MRTEKDYHHQDSNTPGSSAEESPESTLGWLLDLDISEPQETLFVLPDDNTEEVQLSAEELDIAARPMFRGNPGTDDLSAFIEEEIVICAQGSYSDIFSGLKVPAEETLKAENPLPIVHLHGQPTLDIPCVDIADGTDILCLFDNPQSEQQSTPEPPAQQPHTSEPQPAQLEADTTDNLPEVQSLTFDDESFEQYLHGVAPSQGVDDDPEELTATAVNGVDEVDPITDEDIDYHPDFVALGQSGGNSIPIITSVIYQIMEDVSANIPVQLARCDQPDEPITVDVMLGQDDGSVADCLAKGYQPITALCQTPPAGLHRLGQQDIDSIYLRFYHQETGENWNWLFAPSEDIDSVFADFDDALSKQDPNIELVNELAEKARETEESQVFDENLFAAGLDSQLDISIDQQLNHDATNGNVDIDAAFGKEFQAPTAGDEICGIDLAEFAGETEIPFDPLDECQEIVEVSAQAAPCEPPLPWYIPAGINFSHSSQSSSDIFAEFLDAFLEEGSAELDKLEQALGAWESEPNSPSASTVVTRTLHTLKGIAKGVGLHRYGTLIHNFETLLEGLPQADADQQNTESYFAIVNTWLDAAVGGLEWVRANRQDITNELPSLGGDSTDHQQTSTYKKTQNTPKLATIAPTKPALAIVTKSDVSDDNSSKHTQVPPKLGTRGSDRQKKIDKKLADDGAKALAAQQSVRITSEKLDQLLNLSNQAQQLGVRSAQGTARCRRGVAELQSRLTLVRAHISKIADRALLSASSRGHRFNKSLDALEMDQYSELQEAASILREGIEDLSDLAKLSIRQNTQVESVLKQQASVISSISGAIQAARVVPLSRLMPGLRRLVRTVSNDLDKSVTLDIVNEMGALDRDNYAHCQIMLEHMVRNALDHGIESADERLAAGKPKTGRISIDIRKAGPDYIIGLSDDGRGIDPDTMRETAYDKGLDVDPEALTDDEAIRLIFHKGLSTADSLSEISGRGVGMDIVLGELQQMGGDIQIDSHVGRGTRFELHIPSNITVNGALQVSAGNSSYAIPLDGLLAVEHIPVDTFFTAVEQNQPLPVFGVDCEPSYLAMLCGTGQLPPRSNWRNTVPVMVAGNQRPMAIAIDDVEEALELVIRSLGPQFTGVPGLAGAATTSEGEAIVALDLNLLADNAATAPLASANHGETAHSYPLALIVDDSRTQRMVATSQLDAVGVETVTAENGLVALEFLETAARLPDIILLDIEMPVKDGIQTLREIRSSAQYGHLPVIMITSRTGSRHRAMAEAAGCSAFMGKPFNFQRLIEQINRLTGHQLLQ